MSMTIFSYEWRGNHMDLCMMCRQLDTNLYEFVAKIFPLFQCSKELQKGAALFRLSPGPDMSHTRCILLNNSQTDWSTTRAR